jgi:ubiquinone/menaquinone biosynthesis C-methylase UbiE
MAKARTAIGAIADEFWDDRARNYNRLQWATKGDYLSAFIEAGDFRPDDVVLDLGTGTGLVAQSIAPKVRKVIGVDLSDAMLDHARARYPDLDWRQMDAHKLDFNADTFTKVTARMMFHHIIDDTAGAMRECFRVLRPGGLLVLSEGVPPSEAVKDFYTEMFRLKEERITFMEEDLHRLVRDAGFRSVRTSIFWIRQASIRNWLENSGLPPSLQEQIFRMHLDLHEQGKRDYKMTVTASDCLIDMKFVVLTALKPARGR